MHTNFFFIFIFVFALYLVLDIIWFSVFSFKSIYEPQFCAVNGKKMALRKTSSLLSYLILSLGLSLVNFFFYPVSLGESFLLGIVYGFVVYGVYNGTTYSTIEKYKMKTVFVDLLWGMLASGIISVLVSITF